MPGYAGLSPGDLLDSTAGGVMCHMRSGLCQYILATQLRAAPKPSAVSCPCHSWYYVTCRAGWPHFMFEHYSLILGLA